MTKSPGAIGAEHACSVLRSARELASDVATDATRYDDSELTAVLQELLRARAVLEGAALALVTEADERGMVASSTAANLAGWIRTVADEVDVPFTAGEAGTWAHLSLECRRPDSSVLAAACTGGRIQVATGARLARELRTIRSQVPAELWDTCADALTGYAAGGASARELRRAADVVVTQYGDRDWIERQAREAHERLQSPDSHPTDTARCPPASRSTATRSPSSKRSWTRCRLRGRGRAASLTSAAPDSDGRTPCSRCARWSPRSAGCLRTWPASGTASPRSS